MTIVKDTDYTMTTIEFAGCGCPACQDAHVQTAQPVIINETVYPVAGYIGPAQASTLITSYEWGPGGGTAQSLTYSFPTTIPGYYPGDAQEQTNFTAFTSAMKTAAREVFALIETFTNLTFTEVTGSNPIGDITMAQAQLDPGVGAWAYYPDQGSFSGDV